MTASDGDVPELRTHGVSVGLGFLAEHQAPTVVVKAGRVIKPAESGRD